MTEIQRSRLTAKIDELSNEKEKLKEDLVSMVGRHVSAWNEYGSELCAGDMHRQEREITEHISHLGKKIDLLYEALKKDLDLENHGAELVSKLSGINERSEALEKEKLQLVRDICDLDTVANIANGKP